jgi:hypothetical protein
MLREPRKCRVAGCNVVVRWAIDECFMHAPTERRPYASRIDYEAMDRRILAGDVFGVIAGDFGCSESTVKLRAKNLGHSRKSRRRMEVNRAA